MRSCEPGLHFGAQPQTADPNAYCACQKVDSVDLSVIWFSAVTVVSVKRG